MLAPIKKYCDALVSSFDTIPKNRKEILDKISEYISSQKKQNKPVNLVYICTHNARRSHFGQVWAHVAADYYHIPGINTFSGGTEVTELNPNVVKTLDRLGFKIKKITENGNPVYHVFHKEDTNPSICFSKVFDHPENPQKNFAAIMVCSDAEQNCPFVPGVDIRVLTSYEDPKDFENTPRQDEVYNERCRQIALETLYVFSKVHDGENRISLTGN